MSEDQDQHAAPRFVEMWAGQQKLRHAARYLLIELAAHANDQGRCDAPVETLARDTHLAASTVKKILRELEDYGLLRRHGCGIGRARTLVTLNSRSNFSEVTHPSANAVEGY